MSSEAPHIVVGYDRGEPSRHAVLQATRLASRLGAQLHVVHVVDLLDYPIDADNAEWEHDAIVTLQAERNRVTDLLQGWDGVWTYHTERGDPVHALTAIADRHDALMVVVGTHGEGIAVGLQRLLGGGSVGHGLLRGHHRPVLIVPSADGE